MLSFAFGKSRLYRNIALAVFIILFLIQNLVLLPHELHIVTLFKTIGLSAAIATLTTILVMWILKHTVFKLLTTFKKNLLLATTDIAHPEKYMTPCTRKDELGVIINATNNLLQRIHNNIKSLKAHEAIFRLRLDEHAQELSQLENYDSSTGLPNLNLFSKKTNELIKELAEEENQTGIFIIEINNYQEICNNLQYQNKNIFLNMIAKTLENSIPPLSILARIGSNQFAVARQISNSTQFEELTTWILYRLTNPFMLNKHSILLSVNGGVATTPTDGTTAEILIRNAHYALNVAKLTMRNTLQIYKTGMNEKAEYQKSLLADLHHALKNNELIVYYQPKVNLTTNKITGMEALVRWKHPTKGLVSPIDYIPMAEESGLIIPIGEWILKTACEQTYQWNKNGLNLIVAVNLSTVQFNQKSLIETVNRILMETGLPPESLELEITESGIMSNLQESIGIMKALRGLGLSLSIDDFGTGNSSLSYLKRFPVQKLKIDQSFVKELETNQDDRDIAEVIITLGHTLKLKIIAEGIETANHLAFLKSKGCDYGQGYYWSQPVDAETFLKMVNEQV